MGLKLSTPDERLHYPRPVKLTLECDVAEELLCRAVEVFEGGENVNLYDVAVRKVWKERPTRTFHCPVCSGKADSA
jgi:hypothetical protein